VSPKGATAAVRVVDETLMDMRRAVATCEHAAVAELVSSRLDGIDAGRAVT
jgi:hypothetical protein